VSRAIQDAVAQGHGVQSSCQAFGLPRASYYRLRQEPRPKADGPLRQQVQRVALEWSCYGYRRITHELKRQGIQANHKRVLRLMREEGLLRRPRKRFVATTSSDHRLAVYPNLAAEMDVTAPDRLWVSDLTYIRLGHEFIYLAVVLDACSRRCLGWSLGRRLDSALATAALKMALAERKPLVHHSDRGVQYASGEYTSLLKESGVQISMSRRGNPYDNAKAESFMKTLKCEQVYLSEYDNLADAKAQIGHFLEAVYNQKRLHSSLGYLPPAEYETQFEKDWKQSRDKNQTITP
jgi:transposase InsO family protein